jgi:hypothetical protein
MKLAIAMSADFPLPEQRNLLVFRLTAADQTA